MKVIFIFMLACPVHAATDKAVLNFKGTLRASPCIIENDKIDFQFGDIEIDSFTSTTSWIKETIKFRKCPASTSKVKATFAGVPSEDTPEFGYKNTGTAKNVSIQLDRTGGEYGLGNGRSWEIDVKNGTADMVLAARLKKAAEATPGSIQSQVQVTFTYN